MGLARGLHIGADAAVPQQVDRCAQDGGHQLRGRARLAVGTQPATHGLGELDGLQRARVHAAAGRDERGVVVGPARPGQLEQPLPLGERRRRIRVGVEEDVAVVERGHQLEVGRAQQPVAEHVAAHVAHAHHGELVALDVLAERCGMASDALPCAAGGDAHGLVVVAGAAARRERIVEPEAVVAGDAVGDVAERGRALVGGHHQVRIVVVVAHGAGRRDHVVADDVVGEVEQTGDELAVAGHAFGAVLVGVRRRALHHEPALRTGGHDDRVLHDLRLHQPEDLGTEVLTPIAPAQAATGDAAVAQVHALHARRAHPDLVHRARQRQIGHLRGVELERDDVAMAGVGAGPEGVGAQRGVNEREQCTQGAVVVEARHGIEGRHHLGAQRRDVGRIGPVVRWRELRGEQLHQLCGDAGVPGERGLDVLLAEREPDLAQVARVGAQHFHIAGRQPGEQHQPVEAIDLDGVGELGHERGLHLGARLVGEHHALGQFDPDVVHPHRRLEREVERPLVDGAEAEVVEQRQQVGDGHGSPAVVHTEAPLVFVGLLEVHHRGGHVEPIAFGQTAHDGQVDGGAVRPVQLVVAGRHHGQQAGQQRIGRPFTVCGGQDRPCGCSPVVGHLTGGHLDAHADPFLPDDAVVMYVRPVCHRAFLVGSRHAADQRPR